MSVKKKAAIVLAVLLLVSIVISIVISIHIYNQQDKIDVNTPLNTPSNTPINTQTNTENKETVGPTQSEQPDIAPYLNLDSTLPSLNNPQTVHLSAVELEEFVGVYDKRAQAIMYFPDSSIGRYENGVFLLDTDRFYEKNNHIGYMFLSSKDLVYTAYILADKDGDVYIEEMDPITTYMHADNSLKIINRENFIQQEEADNPGLMVQLSNPSYVRDGRTDLYILESVKTPLEQMLEYASVDDSSLNLYVASAYRNYAVQKYSFESWVDRRVNQEGMSYEQAYEYTAGRVAIPGSSEHHNGMTLDIASSGYLLDESSKDAPYAKWLKDNSYKFGFTIRYEQGKEEFTLITLYEPWHLRYVGRPMAHYLHVENLCMEEFYHLLITEKNIAL